MFNNIFSYISGLIYFMMKNRFLIFSLLVLTTSNSYIFSQTSPDNFSGLILWLNGGNVVETNDFVETVHDLSGNNNHAFQSASASMPLRLNNIPELNNNSSLLFDGTNDFLNIPNSAMPYQEHSIFILAKFSGNASNKTLYARAYTTSGFFIRTTAHADYTINNSSLTSTTPINDNSYRLLKYDYDGNVRQLRINSVLNASSNHPSPGPVVYSPNDDASIGALKGNDGGTAWFHDGEIAEIIVFDRQLSSSESNEIELYLYNKYSPQVDLGPDITINHGSCNPNILDAGPRFTSYLWSTGETTSSISVTQSGTYWVETTDIFGVISSDTVIVSYPEIQIPGNLTFCPSQTVTWSAGLGADYTYLWSTNETTESIIINSTGNYFVVVTDNLGCQIASDTLYFEEDPFSSIVSLGPDANLCSGNQLTLENGASGVTDYAWSTGSNASYITITTSGTYYVDVMNGSGCTASDTIVITIIGEAPVVVPVLPSEVCAGEVFSYSENSYTTDGSTIIGRSWDFGDGYTDISQSGEHLFTISDTTYTVSLIVNSDSGCDNQIQQSISVRQQPVFDFSTSGICQLDSIQFIGVTPETGITDWEWNFGEPSSGSDNTASGQNASHIFQTAGNFNVSLMVENTFGCRDTVIRVISVSPTPVVDFTFNEVCQGGIVSFTNESTIESPHQISSTLWNFGGSSISTLFSPTRQYAFGGTFPVTLTVTANNGCSQALTQSMTVYANPQTNYTYSASCAGLETVFTDNSTVFNDDIDQVSWIFNNEPPVSGPQVSFTFPQPGIHQVRQIVTSVFGCQQTTTTSIITHPELKAGFSANPDPLLSDMLTVFENESIGADGYEWSIGDIYTGGDTNPAVTFSSDYIGESVLVRLITYNAYECRDTLTRTYSVSQLRSDLAITQLLIHTDEDEYSTFAVELTNLGTVPVTKADIFFQTTNNTPIKATWEGELNSNEHVIFIAPVSSYQAVNIENKGYVCAQVKTTLPAYFEDEDLSNNELCRYLEKEGEIFVIPFPNPTSGNLSVRVIMPESEIVSLFVYDITGSEVKRIVNDEALPKGLSVFTFSTEQWRAGMYTIVLRGESETKRVKVIKH